MNEIFAAVEGRPKRRQGITGQTIEAQMRGTMCQITEYELDVLREEIARLTAERDHVCAETAMALDGAVWQVRSSVPGHMLVCDTERICDAIRALTPAHATAALAARDKATRKQALREAADLPPYDWDGDPANTFDNYVFVKRDNIIALIGK